METFALALLACALLVLVGAEWPRLVALFGVDARRSRSRARRKSRLSVVEGVGDADDFAESVERDLASLPVLDEHDGSHRRSR